MFVFEVGSYGILFLLVTCFSNDNKQTKDTAQQVVLRLGGSVSHYDTNARNVIISNLR